MIFFGGKKHGSGGPKHPLRPLGRFLLWDLGRVVAVVAGLGGAVWGLNKLEDKQRTDTPLESSLKFEFVHASTWIERALSAELESHRNRSWQDPQVCRDVYDRLAGNGWVRKVRSVGKGRPGVIVVDCEYRQPIALVQQAEYFYLVDEYGVRLPGQYAYNPGWMLIQGVGSPPPDTGRPWPGADVAAGVTLIHLLLTQPFGDQVVAVSVNNYGGREDAYQPHLSLITDRAASRILWGSAPGEEIEENSMAQKLTILQSNFERFGRIDAYQDRIDISVLADRFVIRS